MAGDLDDHHLDENLGGYSLYGLERRLHKYPRDEWHFTQAPYRALVATILLRAVDDIQRGNQYAGDARWFLLSDWAAMLADALDLDPAVMRQWVAGLPDSTLPTE